MSSPVNSSLPFGSALSFSSFSLPLARPSPNSVPASTPLLSNSGRKSFFSSSTSLKSATSQRGLGLARQQPELQPPKLASDSKSSSSLEEEEDEELFVAEVVPGDCNSPLVESGNLGLLVRLPPLWFRSRRSAIFVSFNLLFVSCRATSSCCNFCKYTTGSI